MKRILQLRFCKTLILLAVLVSSIVDAQTIDPSFKSPLPQRAADIGEIIQQPDGKILLAGDIDYFDSKNVAKLIRINPDGSLDKSLRPDLPANLIPYDMELMSSGDILVYDYNRIIKLGPNGRLKNKIEIQGISSVTPLPNGKFFVSTWSGGLYRYKGNFSIDTTFPNQNNFADGPITDLAIQDNKYIICGSFTTINGVAKNDLARLRPNGTVDNSFDTGTGTNDFINYIVVNAIDGLIYLGSYISSFDGVFGFAGLARLNRDGSIDPFFRPITYSSSNNIFFTSDNKILASGYAGISKLNYDGSVDGNFSSIVEDIPVLEQLSDSSLLAVSVKRLGGDYGIARFNANGTPISEFSLPAARLGTITTMDKFSNKLVVAGDFFMINKHRTNNVARINANGHVDVNFKSVNEAGSAFQCSVLADGKILLSGFYDFIRLNQNGDVDGNFEFIPYRKLYQVEYFRAQDDGKIIAGGPNGVYRLNSDGSGDDTFDEGTGICCTGISIFGLDVQSSGKPVYGALFSEFNGTPVNKMVRLNGDASVDMTFNNGSGPDGPVYKIRTLSNDDLIVAGWFSQFDGHAFPGGLVKLKKDGLLDTTFHANFNPSTAYYDFKEFDNKILLAAHTNGKYIITTLHQNGEVANDFTLPAEIIDVKSASKFFVRDSSTLFILGNLTIEGESRPAMLTKVLYTPLVSTQDLVGSTVDSSADDVKYQAFPNPSQNEIIFEVSHAYTVKIIKKFTGETVLETQIDMGNNVMDISNLRPDTYVIQLVSAGRKQTSVLIKY